jgi:hypothetical protein
MSIDSATNTRGTPPERIEIPGDVLVLDAVFCRDVLGGAHPRTAKRYESQGLPTIKIRKWKYRPLREGQEWLAARIERKRSRRTAR